MPTFIFFKKGQKCEVVVGADVRKLKSLLSTLSQGGLPSGGGRVLGTGKPALQDSSSISANTWMFGAIGLLIFYLYLTNQTSKTPVV
jgi:hypothetical protein